MLAVTAAEGAGELDRDLEGVEEGKSHTGDPVNPTLQAHVTVSKLGVPCPLHTTPFAPRRHTLASTAQASASVSPVGAPPSKTTPPATTAVRLSLDSTTAALERGAQGAEPFTQGPVAAAAVKKSLEEVRGLRLESRCPAQSSPGLASVAKKHPPDTAP